jgi:hypothetical protein
LQNCDDAKTFFEAGDLYELRDGRTLSVSVCDVLPLAAQTPVTDATLHFKCFHRQDEDEVMCSSFGKHSQEVKMKEDRFD